MQTPDFTLPAPVVPSGAPDEPLAVPADASEAESYPLLPLDPEEQALIAGGLE